MIRAGSLNALSGVRHAFFTREGGVSEGIYASSNCAVASGDNEASVAENRARSAAALGVVPEALMTARQVHGTGTLTVAGPWADAPTGEADALVTNTPGVAIGLLTADCAPVLLADPVARVAGAAHAGWRGALAGVTDSAVDAMRRLGAVRGHVTAAVGPCIAQESYEVGPDLIEAFLEHDPGNERFFTPLAEDGKRRFDLPHYLAMRLAVAGIGAVEVVALDTCAGEARFFSYRRSVQAGAPDGGRQLSAIVLAEA
jgi:YfiH family protein